MREPSTLLSSGGHNDRAAGVGKESLKEQAKLKKELSDVQRRINRVLDELEVCEDNERGQYRERLRNRNREKADKEYRLARLVASARDAKPVTVHPEVVRAVVQNLARDVLSGDVEIVKPLLDVVVTRVDLWNDKGRAVFALPLDASSSWQNRVYDW